MDELSKLSHVEVLDEVATSDIPGYAKAEAYRRMASTEPDWQPIETAPKDGSWVDLWDAWDKCASQSRWDEDRAGWWHLYEAFATGWEGATFQEGMDSHITHWAPRPKGPVDD